jgi:sugar lactone lactonase YvrE
MPGFRSHLRRLALLSVAAAVACGGPRTAPVTEASPSPAAVVEPVVTTLAGNGRMRADDGDLLGAAFLFPYGIAVAPDGTMYVADAGAQAIRRIKDGKVTFVSGTADEGPSPQARTGGYIDGEAMAAHYLWPTGLALARDGALYIADAGNHCIRVMRNGTVTTYAGSRTPGKNDGTRHTARFLSPQGLAVDDEGNVYVADFGAGIRRISPDGSVKTLDLPSKNGRVLAVAVWGAGPSLALAYTEDRALHFVPTGAASQTLHVDDPIEPEEDERRAAGSFYGVTFVGPRAVVVTDVLDDVVRFVRFRAPPFDTYISSRVIAGAEREGDGAVGGYADGYAPASRVNMPLAVARTPDGSVVFTDAGNRRIRTISGLDPRGPAGADLVGLYGPKDAYRVSVVGDSFAFSNVLWPESIAGRIEAALAAPSSGLGKRAFVGTVRLDGTSITDLSQFVREHLGDGQTDLVVMLVDDFTHAHELDRADARGDRWRTLMPQRLRALQGELAKHGTQLLLVLIPRARSASLNELPEVGAFNDGLVTALAFEQDAYRERQVEHFYSTIRGVRALPLLGPMQLAEADTHRVSFFNTRDIHLSPQGATWVGDRIGEELARWKPWR